MKINNLWKWTSGLKFSTSTSSVNGKYDLIIHVQQKRTRTCGFRIDLHRGPTNRISLAVHHTIIPGGKRGRRTCEERTAVPGRQIQDIGGSDGGKMLRRSLWIEPEAKPEHSPCSHEENTQNLYRQ
ncbi:uncharacterized protein LOC132400922 isoform X3 [Hypanus sabinus]|uniref:uncharacterized protein LOC132400922 isoform X3 n=1 Tax=Hypanus sabinus TaxID=79690 RepID=UPI0028C41246|nr:uncharacterized protein LOC132400922 isoform X3 [Hypanus sabinus]